MACGPGYVSRAARALGAETVGVDFTLQIVQQARERNPEIPFHEGNAQALEFEDNTFDAIAMNFGVLHLSDPEAAFAEARRVLRPGGRYGFTVWASPEVSPGARLVEEAIEAFAEPASDFPQGPDFYGYGDPEESRRVLGRHGFDPASVDHRTVTIDWLVPTAAYVFEAERDHGVRSGAILAVQAPETLDSIQAQIERSVQQYARDDGFALPFAAHLIAATAP